MSDALTPGSSNVAMMFGDAGSSRTSILSKRFIIND